MADNPLAPRLRFPEFRDNGVWERVSLSKCSDRVRQRVGDSVLSAASISAGKGFVLQSSRFGKDISGYQYRKYVVLEQGDFSYNRGNSKKFPQGSICCLREYDLVAVPDAFISFRLGTEFCPPFIQAQFDRNDHGLQLKRFITSGARSDGLLNVNANDFFSILIFAPSRTEQEKIAACLTSLDEAIAATQAKLEALREHKRGLMQNLFPHEGETTPRLRFPEFRDLGEWRISSFMDIYRFLPTNSLSRGQLTYEGGDLYNIHYGDIHTTYQSYFRIQSSAVPCVESSAVFPGISEQSFCREGDVILADASEDLADVGKSIELVDLNGKSVLAGMHTIHARPKDSCMIVGFAAYLLASEWMRQQIRKESQGTKVYGISVSRLGKIALCMPPGHREQAHILHLMQSLDEAIAATVAKLEALREHKRGLMQNLFPRITDEPE